MKTLRLLVCGTRKKGYEYIVQNEIRKYINDYEQYNIEIIEGCCKGSADEYVENFLNGSEIKIHHYPSHSGEYLHRNIEMVKFCDECIAFWDGFSYGTSQTISQCVLNNKRVRIIQV
jgi:hypothetical protein